MTISAIQARFATLRRLSQTWLREITRAREIFPPQPLAMLQKRGGFGRLASGIHRHADCALGWLGNAVEGSGSLGIEALKDPARSHRVTPHAGRVLWGLHGHGRVSRAVLGSTAAAIAAETPCSVVICQANAER
jgi:hypothetical protein